MFVCVCVPGPGTETISWEQERSDVLKNITCNSHIKQLTHLKDTI